METPQFHYNRAKQIESFVIHLIGRKQTEQTFNLALFSAAHDYNRGPLLLSELELDPDLVENLTLAINHILAQQITRHLTKQHSAAAMVEQSAKAAAAEKSRAIHVQKTIFEVSEDAAAFLNNLRHSQK